MSTAKVSPATFFTNGDGDGDGSSGDGEVDKPFNDASPPDSLHYFLRVGLSNESRMGTALRNDLQPALSALCGGDGSTMRGNGTRGSGSSADIPPHIPHHIPPHIPHHMECSRDHLSLSLIGAVQDIHPVNSECRLVLLVKDSDAGLTVSLIPPSHRSETT